MTLEETFVTAIVDGINIYFREALKPKGFLNPDKIGDIGCEELLELKYKIAKELGHKWAVMIIKE